ncbi:MAG TPA: hydroxyisourate hydrolase [Gaiellaceae bacterium]
MISTHVLDTEAGEPAAGVKVGLFRGADLVSLQETDRDGRISDFSEGQSLGPGEYRLVFYVERGFFDRVEATIVLEPGRDRYHVPLLLAPYQCTIYRGS